MKEINISYESFSQKWRFEVFSNWELFACLIASEYNAFNFFT